MGLDCLRGSLPWLLILLAGAIPARAQLPEAPLFRPLGVADGLPSSEVYKLAQDREGYLWMATGDGLARFDGVRFAVHQHDPQDPRSLPSNVVQELHFDARDRLWLAAEGEGLSLMQAAGEFRHFNARTDARFALDDVFAIVSGPDGVIWFGGYGGGLYRFDPALDSVTRFRHDDGNAASLVSDHVLDLAFDADGSLWVGTNLGLDRFRDGAFEHIGAGAGALSGPFVISLWPAPDGSLWIGTATGIDLRTRDGRVMPAPRGAASAERARALLHDRQDSLWIGNSHGLRHLPAAAARNVGGVESPHLLVDDAIQDILEDHEGGLWFATRGNGILRLPSSWRNFSVLHAGDPARGGIGTDQARGAAEAPDGSVWVVGHESLDRIAPDGSITRHAAPGELDATRLRSVWVDAAGIVWIGGNTLIRYDPQRATHARWSHGLASSAGPASVIDLMQGMPDGTFWLWVYGVALQQRDANGDVIATLEPGATSGLPPGDVEALDVGPDGALWIAAGEGLWRHVAGTARVEPVPGSPKARVFGFDFAPDGSLWLQRVGVVEHHRLHGGALQHIESIGAAQGMPAVPAGGLKVDPAGTVWVTTTRGLLRYVPASATLRHYGVRDGLPTPEFYNRPPLVTRAGVVVAATVDGLVMFDPARLEEDRSAPRLHVESVRIRRDDLMQALPLDTALTLRHDDRELQINARLMSFADPQSHRHRFRLDGYERDWVETGASGERVFSQLAPGAYRLQVVAANSDGVWSAPPRSIEITVLPPWWSTPWAFLAYALVVSALAVLASLLYRYRMRRRQARQLARGQREWALRALEAKSSFLATLGHEIRTPMTGVLGMAELLQATPLQERQRGFVDAIRRSGELLLRLVNDALDLARIEAGRLELSDGAIDVATLLREVAEFEQPLAERKGLSLTFDVDPDAPRWLRGDAMRIKQILLNLCGNAIKFTERGGIRLSLRAAPAPHTAQFAVSDSGPGLNAEQQARLFQRFSQADGALTAMRHGGSGLGLAICRELAAMMGGRIDVDSVPGEGSEFRVLLPLLPSEPPLATTVSATPMSADSLPRRILLVEDDATVAAVVSGLLEAQGHRVWHVGHGLAALGELAQQDFDLALLDLDLPGVDGFELARLIRAQGHTLPLVTLTARSDAEAEPLSRAAGMTAFVRKPVTGDMLAELLRELGERAR